MHGDVDLQCAADRIREEVHSPRGRPDIGVPVRDAACSASALRGKCAPTKEKRAGMMGAVKGKPAAEAVDVRRKNVRNSSPTAAHLQCKHFPMIDASLFTQAVQKTALTVAASPRAQKMHAPSLAAHDSSSTPRRSTRQSAHDASAPCVQKLQPKHDPCSASSAVRSGAPPSSRARPPQRSKAPIASRLKSSVHSNADEHAKEDGAGVSGLGPPAKQGTTHTRRTQRPPSGVADVVESRDGQRSSSGLNLD